MATDDTYTFDPETDASIDLTTVDIPTPTDTPPTAAAYADPADIDTHIEVPFDAPSDTWRIVAVLRDRDTGRTIRHRFDYTPSRERLTELEIGLVNGKEVYRRERDGLAFRPGGDVHITPLDETMPLEEYVDCYAFDEATWRLGAGFGELGGVPKWAE